MLRSTNDKINTKLQYLTEEGHSDAGLSITYFQPDSRKTGGEYKTVITALKKIDSLQRFLILDNESKVPFHHIIDINSINLDEFN